MRKFFDIGLSQISKKQTIIDICVILFFAIMPFVYYLNCYIPQTIFDLDINPVNPFQTQSQTWVLYNSVGSPFSNGPASFTLYFFYFLSTKIGIPIILIRKSFFMLVLSLAGFSIKYLLDVTLQKKLTGWIRYLPIVFFMYSPFVLIFGHGDYNMLVPGIVLPLQLGLLIVMLREKSYEKAIFLGFSFIFLNAAQNFISVLINVIVLFVYICYWLITIPKSKFELKSFIKLNMLWMGVAAGICCYWIIPFFCDIFTSFSANSALVNNMSRESYSMYNANSSGLEVFRMFGNWSFYGSNVKTGQVYHNYRNYFMQNPLAIIASFALPIMIWMSALMLKKNRPYKRTMAFFYLLAIGIIPCIIGAYPFLTSNLYKWLYKNLFFVQGFRNTYKWMSVLSMSYAIILGYLLYNLSAKNIKKVSSLILVCLMITSYPFWGGRLFEETQKISQVPDYWYACRDYVNNNDNVKRIIALPQGIADFNWGHSVTCPGSALFKKNYLTYLPYSSSNTYADKLRNGIFENIKLENWVKFGALCKLLGVTNLLQRDDFAWYEHEGIFSNEKMHRILSESSILDKGKRIGKLSLYKIKSEVLPLIYSSQ